MKRLIQISLITAFVAGCAGMDNREPAAPLADFDATKRLDRAWRTTLHGTVGRQMLALRPVATADRVYAAGEAGRVYAFGTEDGSQVWSVSVGTQVAAGPGYGDGLVVVVTSKGEVVALDADQGTERWRARLHSEILATPAVDRNMVAVRTTDGRLIALDAADGHRMWDFMQRAPALTLRGSAAPIIAGDLVIAGYDNGKLVANHVRDGLQVWDAQLSTPAGRTEVERMVDVNATPRVIGRDLYAVNYQGRVAAMSVETGRILWSQQVSSSAGLGADARAVYVTDANSVVRAYDRLTGDELWRQPRLRARSVTAPVSFMDTVVVGDYRGYMHWISKETGEFVVRERVDRFPVRHPPVVYGDMMFVQGEGGTLTAFRFID